MSEEIKSNHLRALAEEIKPRTLRALACDIEDCHEPQSWADYCRAAATMLEIKDARIAELEAALAALQRDASQEIATDEMVRRLQHLGDWQAADRIEALQARVAELEEALRDLLPEAIDHRYATQSLAVVQARAALTGGKNDG